MSERKNLLLKRLIEYGNTGKYEVLIKVATELSANEKFGTVHLPLALRVSKHILCVLEIPFMENPFMENLCFLAWQCLTALCCVSTNQNAADFLDELQKSSILVHVLKGCLSESIQMQGMCLYFLDQYIMNNDSRRGQAFNQDGLFDALVLRQLLAHDSTGERFVRSRSMKALDNLLGKVAAFCVPNAPPVPNAIFSHTAEQCLFACHLAHYSVMTHERKLEDVGCPESFLFLTEQQALRALERWYYLLKYLIDTTKSAYIRDRTSMYLLWALDYYVDSIAHANRLDNERQFTCICRMLEFSGASTGADSPQQPSFIQFALQSAHAANSLEDVDRVFGYVLRCPPLKSVIEKQVGKFEFCAHPDCPVTNYVPRRLKKCVRCRCAWYCGREHQVAHWKEHKLTCKPCAVAEEVTA